MKNAKQHVPREMMMLAIEVMRQSVPEPRVDSKASPKVGAVLVKPDGTVETACRGELRHGDHAEFTLLERKNRGNKLDGSILFATLGPCAKGSRKHPKVSCAERLFLARIKEVWVGIQDPDPTVARKGNFSGEALEAYRKNAKIADAVGSQAFNQRLLRQGALKDEGGVLVPTGFGFLLFGKEPRTFMRQAGLLGLIHYPSGKQERREFDEPAVLIPDLLEQWLTNKLSNVFDRNQAQRQEQAVLPFEMVREAVANALIHRDYSIEGAKCQIVVTEDTVIVQSPGKPPLPITMEQLQDFSAPMLSRNPELHFVFARIGMAEEQGLGLDSLRDRATKLDLPLPRFSWDDPYLVLTLYRSRAAAGKTLPEAILKSLSKSERKGWEWIAARQALTSGEYAEAMEIPYRTAMNHLGKFVALGLLEEPGSGKATEYKTRKP